MRKKEIKNGMMVELRSGRKYFALKDTNMGNIFVSTDGEGTNKTFEEFTPALISKKNENNDIIAVYDADSIIDYLNADAYSEVWRREGSDRICLVNFPNSNKNYAFVIPARLMNICEGNKVVVETRRGQNTVVKVAKIFDSDSEAKKSGELAGLDFPLCQVIRKHVA